MNQDTIPAQAEPNQETEASASEDTPEASTTDSELESESSSPGHKASPADSMPGSKTMSRREANGKWYSNLLPFRRNGSSIRDDLADVLADENGNHTDLSPEERSMLQSILRLRTIRVEDLMVARAEMQAVDIDTTLADLLKAFEDSGHSRMPVYADGLDDPKGMIHIRDVLTYITGAAHVTRAEAAKRKAPVPGNLDLKKVNLSRKLGSLKLIRPVLFVPPSMMASELMARMQANRIQMALVIDEYGGTDGLVSLEDIVEVIVGDIEDEHDEDDSHMISDQGDGVYVVDAKAELEDMTEILGDSITFADHAEDVETIGGLIFALLGRVPVRGEVIQAAHLEFRILDADPRRIRSIEISPAQRRRNKKTSPGE